MNVWQTLKDRIQGKAPKGARRSSRWTKARKRHLEKNPRCEVCGSKKALEVHHVIPFSIAPDLELDPSNFISLCENKKYGINCHLLLGHLGNYRRFNASVKADVMYLRMRLGKVPSTTPL